MRMTSCGWTYGAYHEACRPASRQKRLSSSHCNKQFARHHPIYSTPHSFSLWLQCVRISSKSKRGHGFKPSFLWLCAQLSAARKYFQQVLRGHWLLESFDTLARQKLRLDVPEINFME